MPAAPHPPIVTGHKTTSVSKRFRFGISIKIDDVGTGTGGGKSFNEQSHQKRIQKKEGKCMVYGVFWIWVGA
jgi:hypothetical protein